MAEKTTTTRGRTVAKKVATEEAVVETAVKEVVEVVETKPEPRVIQDTDRITVMNNTTGVYGYHGKNGFSFDLAAYGETIDIPFSELRIIKAGQDKIHIMDAWIIILDEDAVDQLNLTALYRNIYDDEQVDILLENSEAIRNAFPTMPKAMQTTIVARAMQKFKAQELNDYRVITAIKEVSGVDLIM